MENFISLDHVGKAYRTSGDVIAALQDVSLGIDQGDMVAIIGPSGSGKSTMLTLLGAMNAPTQGRVVINGIDVYKLSVEKQADFRRDYVG
ncbi:partial ABC transporter ATP-binding protein YxdL, partial [Anaerolineae bacterium]